MTLYTKLHAARYLILGLIVGVALTAFGSYLFQGPGQITTNQKEAEGVTFRDPHVVDLYSHVEVRKACPKVSTRYAWRYEMHDGVKMQRAYPLFSTLVPFLPDVPDVIMSGPVGDLPDPTTGGWSERTNSAENCFLPPVTKGPDVPTNFIGGSEQEVTP